MNKVFRDYLLDLAMVDLEDVLCFSKTKQEQEGRLGFGIHKVNGNTNCMRNVTTLQQKKAQEILPLLVMRLKCMDSLGWQATTDVSLAASSTSGRHYRI